MRHPTWPLLFSACLLAGCATVSAPYPGDMEQRLAAYGQGAACCEDPAEFAYAELPASGSLDFVIGRANPLFEFQSGLSPFAAFRLPDTGQPYRVRIKSYFDGPAPPGGSIFYPVLAMMDDAFIVTRVSNLDNLSLDLALATPGGENGLEITAPFDPGQMRERYLVVFTPAILLGAPPDERRDGDVLTGPTLDWLDRRGNGVVSPSPYGRLHISIAPVAPPG